VAAAIRGQRLDGEIEFLLVDGGSNDGTRELLDDIAREDPRVRVLENPRRQLASALNIGLANARGEFVAQMDAHSYYPPNYVSTGIERLRRGGADWVTGPPLPHGTDRWSRRVALALGSWLGTGASAKWPARQQDSGEVELDTSVFAGVWRRTTLERHGGWDEGWPVNHDSELAARVLEAGGRIVCLPEMGAHYVPRSSPAALARQYWRYGYYRAKTARRHPESLRASHLLAPAITLALPLAAVGPRRLRRFARAALGGYGLALAAETARTARREPAADAAALPAVLATMHGAWGTGFLAGCVAFGPPLEAAAHSLGRALGLRRG
jgi:glycosyltransferase involved in cell wall biosynthesis